MTKQEYLDKYYQAAQNSCAGTPIFPLLALAESACENAWGEKIVSNNLFGIKADKYWTGPKVLIPTHEGVTGHQVAIDDYFRAYDKPEDSFADFVHFVQGPRYVQHGVTTATSAEEQIKAIAASGYSSNPEQYVTTITSIIHSFEKLLAA